MHAINIVLTIALIALVLARVVRGSSRRSNDAAPGRFTAYSDGDNNHHHPGPGHHGGVGHASGGHGEGGHGGGGQGGGGHH